MPIALDQLPNDVDALKSLLTDQVVHNEQLQADKQAALQKNGHLTHQVLILQEQLNLALARRYAASSEKVSPDQIWLFDAAEAAGSEPDLAEATSPATIAEHTRKTGRKPLPDTLPRIDVAHELDAADRVCPHRRDAERDR